MVFIVPLLSLKILLKNKLTTTRVQCPYLLSEMLLLTAESKLSLLFSVMGCPRGVMVKAMDCGIVVYEFVLQSRYYVHFRANTLGKGMNPLILPAMG